MILSSSIFKEIMKIIYSWQQCWLPSSSTTLQKQTLKQEKIQKEINRKSGSSSFSVNNLSWDSAFPSTEQLWLTWPSYTMGPNGSSMATLTINANLKENSCVSEQRHTLSQRTLETKSPILVLAMNSPATFVLGYFLGTILDLFNQLIITIVP